MIINCKATVVADSAEAVVVAAALYEAVEAIEERGGTNIRINKPVSDTQATSGGTIYTISFNNSNHVNSFDLSWTEEL